jgi:endonuclease YncB( thermonuclease family)
MRFLGFAFGLLALIGPVTAKDMRLVDADTIEWDGTKYRLDGIDAPETAQKCLSADGKPWRCGQEAAKALSAFMAGKTVSCNDVGEDRKYQRRLGRCFADGVSIEHWLVREGWALEFKMHSDGRFTPDERDAKRNRRGIWSGCFTDPRDFRYSNKTDAVLRGICPTSPELIATARDALFWKGFMIKAKFYAAARRVASGLNGIYHTEGCSSFGKMATEEGGKTLFFTSADAAEASGFRKALNCLVR